MKVKIIEVDHNNRFEKCTLLMVFSVTYNLDSHIAKHFNVNEGFY